MYICMYAGLFVCSIVKLKKMIKLITNLHTVNFLQRKERPFLQECVTATCRNAEPVSSKQHFTCFFLKAFKVKSKPMAEFSHTCGALGLSRVTSDKWKWLIECVVSVLCRV